MGHDKKRHERKDIDDVSRLSHFVVLRGQVFKKHPKSITDISYSNEYPI